MLEWKDVPVGVAYVKDKKQFLPHSHFVAVRLQNLEAIKKKWILYHALIHNAIATARGTHG